MVPMHVSFDTETLDDATFSVQKIVDYYKATTCSFQSANIAALLYDIYFGMVISSLLVIK